MAWKHWDAANLKESSVPRTAYIGYLLRQDEIEAATLVLQNDPDDDWAALNKCLVAVYESDYLRVNEICDRLMHQKQLEPQARSITLALLFLAGREQVAKTTAKRWLSDDSVSKDGFEQEIWKFLSLQHVDRSELKRVENCANDSRFNECRAQFYMGIRLLAQNQVEEATDCFRAADETGMFHALEIQWARVLLHTLSKASASRQHKV